MPRTLTRQDRVGGASITEADRPALIARLVEASGLNGYASAAATWPLDQIREKLASFEADAAVVDKRGHLGAVWASDAQGSGTTIHRR